MSEMSITESWGWSQEKITLVFYLICIPSRLTIGLGIYLISYFKEKFELDVNNIIAWLVWGAAMLSIILNFRKIKWTKNSNFGIKNLPRGVWWSRKFHFIIGCLLVLLSILALAEIIETKELAWLVWIDALFGLFYSFKIKKD